MSTKIALEQIRIASPCTARWEDMMRVGDGAKARHCGQCGLDVHDLSAMTREEAESLVGGAEGRMCVRLYKRADGRVITRDCPVGLRAARLAMMQVVGRVAAVIAVVVSGGAIAGARARGGAPARVGRMEPFATVRSWLKPTPWSTVGMQQGRAMITMGSTWSPAIPGPAAGSTTDQSGSSPP